MRIILGILSGLLAALAGWFGLAFLVVSLAGPDRDGGIAMGAFFNIGPIGGLAGFIAGIWLFSKIGLIRAGAPPRRSPAAQPGRRRAFRVPLPSPLWRSPQVSPGGRGTSLSARLISRTAS
jgi:hypothetical protein